MKTKEIESYIFDYEDLLDDEREELIKGIEDNLEDVDVYKILDCFFKYSDKKYLKGKVEDILNLLKKIINKKIETLSLIKVIDLYIKLFNKTLIVSDTLMASKNILAVMSYNISDNEYIKKEITKKKLSREEYVATLKKDLDKNLAVIESYKKTYNYLDKLQDDILVFIESKLAIVKDQEKYYLIQNINKRFSDASVKLLKLKDNLGNIKNLDRNELFNTLEYNELKNHLIIYESFRNSLLNDKNSDNEKDDNQE